MKVLLINKYHYIRGGSETYYFGLAKLLQNAGHEVIFFAMQDEKNYDCAQSKYFVSNVEFNGELSFFQKISAGFRLVYSFEAKRKITQLIRDERPDIIHINLFHRVITVSIIDAAKKHKIPVVLTMHDLNCICPNHTMLDHGKICEACLYGRYFQCVKRKCFKDSRVKCMMAALESRYNKISGAYNKIDLFITPSAFYKNKLAESGITKSQIRCMRNFLNKDTVFKADIENDGYYLYFGRLTEEKGILTLLSAMKKLDGRVRLKIAGTGPQKDEIKEFVMQNNMSGYVELMGFLKGEALDRTVSGAKCIILPSEWHENGPYAIMEAMACGKPAIVSEAGGLPEIVKENKTGFISRVFDAGCLAGCIEKMESLGVDEYKKMSMNAVNNAKILFDADRYTDELTGIYNQLIHSGGLGSECIL